MLGKDLDEEIRGDNILVEWFLPESSRSGGRHRARPDIFAAWTPFAERQFGGSDVMLPGVIVPQGNVLVGAVELEEDKYIPFACFDRLRADYAIDVSGLSLSRTPRGNMYLETRFAKQSGL